MPLVFLGINALIGFLAWLLIPVIGYIVRVWGLGLARITMGLTAFLVLVLGLAYVSIELLRDAYAELPPSIADNAMLFIPANALPCMFII
ncbi:TPA: phage coat protein, partial [Salmonella enterica]|nr:phage coat protein [Salmonella enterica]